MAWILTKNKTNGSGGESQIDTIKVNDVILIPDSDKAVNIEVPTNTNDLVNNSGFITNTVDNLLNYYLKTETYSKNEVNSLIDAVSSVTFEVVQVLPSQDISLSTIYLVPKQDAETNDIYDEYIYVNDVWEKIGSTEMDLTDYVTTSDLNNALAAYTTSQNLNNLLNAKQDVLTPGNNINITNGVISATDTTYTSKSAVSGGSDVSLVTTGEKYSWNSKQDKTDNGIKTTAKTVVGAINELLNKFTNYFTKTEVNEKVDPIKAHTRTNLLNPTAQTQTKNGVTFTNNGDGTYTVNGTANARANIEIQRGIVVNVGDKFRVCGASNDTNIVIVYYKSGAFVSYIICTEDRTFQVPDDVNRMSIELAVESGTTVTNKVIKPMLTTDLSATYDDFVGYSGDGELNENVAEIYKVSDRVSNETYTNLINPSILLDTQTINGVTCTNNGDGTFTLNGTASARIFFRLSVAVPSGVAVYEKGRRYKLTGCPSSGVPDKLALRYLQFQNGTQINYREDSKGGTIVTILQNTDNAYFSIVVDNGLTVNNVTFKPMLTTKLDATYNDYIPYSGSGALNENVAEIKSNLSAIENSLTAITLTKSGYTTITSAAIFGTCAFISFLTSDFNQSTTGWITLFTFSNINITPTATCYSTAIDNFGKALMLRITPNREVSVYKYETNTPSDIRGQIIFPI